MNRGETRCSNEDMEGTNENEYCDESDHCENDESESENAEMRCGDNEHDAENVETEVGDEDIDVEVDMDNDDTGTNKISEIEFAYADLYDYQRVLRVQSHAVSFIIFLNRYYVFPHRF